MFWFRFHVFITAADAVRSVVVVSTAAVWHHQPMPHWFKIFITMCVCASCIFHRMIWFWDINIDRWTYSEALYLRMNNQMRCEHGWFQQRLFVDSMEKNVYIENVQRKHTHASTSQSFFLCDKINRKHLRLYHFPKKKTGARFCNLSLLMWCFIDKWISIVTRLSLSLRIKKIVHSVSERARTRVTIDYIVLCIKTTRRLRTKIASKWMDGWMSKRVNVYGRVPALSIIIHL